MDCKSFLKEHKTGIFLLLLISILFFHFSLSKKGYYIDEIYTYGLSNSHYAPYLSDVAGGDLQDKTLTKQDLKSYVCVDEGETFDFASVYYNQERDVHPPLYYWLFNSTSSLTPGTFSKWTGLVLNFLLFLGSLLALAKVCDELFRDRNMKYWAWALYGLSCAGISTAVLLRMYELLTFCTLLLVFSVLRLLHTKRSVYAPLCGAAVFLGMMTQYYFVIFAFFLCLAVCTDLIVRKQIRLMLLFGLCALLGVAGMVAAFPASLQHVFVGNGQVVSGGVALSNILDGSQWAQKLNSYAHFVSHGIKLGCVVGIVVLVFLLVTKRFRFSEEMAVLVIPALAAWGLIALMAPVKEERYIYNILPVFVLFVVYLLSLCHTEILPILCIAVIAFTSAECNPDYLQLETPGKMELLKDYPLAKCVYLTEKDQFAAITSDFDELYLFESVFTTADPASARLKEYAEGEKELIVFVDTNEEWSSGFDADEQIRKLLDATAFSASEEILSNSLSEVYVVR